MPRPLKVLVLVLASALIAGVVIVAVVANSVHDSSSGDNSPYSLVPVSAPRAASRDCRKLIRSLPDDLTDGKRALHTRPLAKPVPDGAKAWGAGGSPVVLRCGLPMPRQLNPTSQLVEVSGVRWLEITDHAAGGDSVTAYAVDRPVYVALTMPTDTGTGPLQEVSATVARVLPATPVRIGG